MNLVALEKLSAALREGAVIGAEVAQGPAWRARVQALPNASPSIGANVFLMGNTAKTLLLQRGQMEERCDVALQAILVELANIFEMLTDTDRGKQERQINRNAARRLPRYDQREN